VTNSTELEASHVAGTIPEPYGEHPATFFMGVAERRVAARRRIGTCTGTWRGDGVDKLETMPKCREAMKATGKGI
jgi:hypothetical protein